MVLQSVLASKLYRASNHQSRILAAMEDATNSELVAQLASQLPDRLEGDATTNNMEFNYLDRFADNIADVDNTMEQIDETDPSGVDTSLGHSMFADDSAADTAVDEDKLLETGLDSVLLSSIQANGCAEDVLRTRATESELWIYYQDNVNLNSALSSVLDIIDSASSTQGALNSLHFNRLARTENAIVFDII